MVGSVISHMTASHRPDYEGCEEGAANRSTGQQDLVGQREEDTRHALLDFGGKGKEKKLSFHPGRPSGAHRVVGPWKASVP